MGLSLKNITKRISDIAQGVERQVNPFDNGMTYKQRTSTGNRSVIQQATHNGVTNFVGNNVVKPVAQFPLNASAQLYNRVVAPAVNLPQLPKNTVSFNPTVQNVARNVGATGTTAQTIGSGIQTALTIGAPGASKLIEAGVGRVLPEATSPLISRVTPKIASNATIGGGVNAAAVGGQGGTTKDIVKGAAEGAALGAAFPVAGEGLRAGGKVAVKLADNRVPLNETGSVKLPTVKEKTTTPKGSSVQPVKTDSFKGQLTQALVEEDAPIIKNLRNIEKQTGQTGLVDKFMYNSGLQRRANSIGVHHFQNSENISTALGGLDKQGLKNFEDYTAARRELANADKGLKTSRPKAELQATVSNLGPQYEGRFAALNAHYQDLAGVLKDSGIISQKKYNSFVSDPNYVRVQRNMDELVNKQFGSGNSYSLGTTLTSKRRVGSRREVLPASRTALDYTQRIHNEVARNQTASHLIDTLEASGQAKRIANATTHRNTIKRFVNGKLQTYEVSPEIKKSVERINPFELNTLSQIAAAPGRLFRAGTTGLNPVFTATNWVRDQGGSLIMSKNALRTHDPRNIGESLGRSIRDLAGGGKNDASWQRFIMHAGDQTSYDLTRNIKGAKRVVREVRGGAKNRATNIVLAPVRTLEDLNSVTEKSTRFQNFKGIYEDALASGKSEGDALQAATLAAWQNSVDFNRAGSWSRMINLLVPYWNPGVQGSRQLARSLKQRPVATTTKIASWLATPVMAATLWNMHTKENRDIYNNIPEYDKENNIIVIPPGTKQNPDGSYNVWKLPLPPGVGQLAGLGRRAVESYQKKNPQDIKGMANDVFTAFSGPVNLQDKSKFAQSFIPQWAKPEANQIANRDLYTGQPIVPDYIQQATDANGNPVPEGQKAYPHTSGTAQLIGKKLNISPIRIEKGVKDITGSVGLEGLNAVDNALASRNVVPRDQIGGTSIAEGFSRRFAKTQGIENYNKSEGAKYFDSRAKATAGLTANERAAYDSLHPSTKNFLGEKIYESDTVYNPAARLDIYNRYPKVFQADKKLDAEQRKQGKPGNPLFDLQSWQVKKVLEKENLPPGATDPELSNLRTQDWYAGYQTKKSQFFDQIAAQQQQDLATAKAKGDTKTAKAIQDSINKYNSSDNPYPVTPPDLQKVMDAYSALPKGTGARSAWIKANPGPWAAMQNQFAAVDNWQNKQRQKRGLDTTEGAQGVAAGYGSSSSGNYSGGGKRSNSSTYSGEAALTNVGKFSKTPTIPKGKKASIKVSTAKLALSGKRGGAKPKVSLKASKV